VGHREPGSHTGSSAWRRGWFFCFSLQAWQSLRHYFVALWKFRATNNPKADYKGVKTKTITNSIEGAVIVAELVLVVLAIYYWNFYVNKPTDFSEASEEGRLVRVTAEQFAWNARYPGADGKLGAQSKTLVSAANPFGIDKSKPYWEDDVEVLKSDIVVPMIKNEDGTHKSVTIDLTSMDVIHCFKVLPLRVCQDVIPGMRIPIHFRPVKVEKKKPAAEKPTATTATDDKA